MQATRIIAIRHGETDWNVDNRIQGQRDVPLNARGHWQAARLAGALADGGAIDAIYTSDLQRAQDTARRIALATGVPLTLEAGLRERGFGDFEGLTFTELEQRWPHDTARWRARDPDWAPPRGETLAAVRARVEHAATTLARRHLGGQIVLVAHGGVLDALYRRAARLDPHAPRTWTIGNASINRLLWTPEGLSVVGWADNGHLEDSALDEGSA